MSIIKLEGMFVSLKETSGEISVIFPFFYYDYCLNQLIINRVTLFKLRDFY